MITQDPFLDRLQIAKGSRIVDVGFGSNKELLTLSSIVGETGLVFGIGPSETLVKKTEREINVANVRISVRDAVRLPFPEDLQTSSCLKESCMK